MCNKGPTSYLTMYKNTSNMFLRVRGIILNDEQWTGGCVYTCTTFSIVCAWQGSSTQNQWNRIYVKPFDMDSFKHQVEVTKFNIVENHITEFNWKSSVSFCKLPCLCLFLQMLVYFFDHFNLLFIVFFLKALFSMQSVGFQRSLNFIIVVDQKVS